MQKQSKFLQSQYQSLKNAYPDIEKRRFYKQKKLKNTPLKNPFLLRIQPMGKYFHQHQKVKFITLIAEGATPMSQITANVHKKLGLPSSSSLFMVSKSQLICNNKKVQQMIQKCEQQDGIMYIRYADQDPFGTFLINNKLLKVQTLLANYQNNKYNKNIYIIQSMSINK